jgi:signal transduction histidine kinase
LPEAFWRIRDELVLEDGVGFRVIVEGHPHRLHPLLRDEVYRIGREALVNAARHSRAKSIEVELEYSHKRLRVLVRDDGRGIDDSRVLRFGRQGHWGLPGMYERAERIGGRLSIWSSASAGTEVELSVPGLVAYESKSSTAFRRWLAVWTQWRRSLTRL